jgi:hypothetical protein
MFSKSTMVLAMTLGLVLTSNAMAQQTKKPAVKAAEAKAKEAQLAEEKAKALEAAKKLEAEKKLAEEKAAAEAPKGILSKISASYHGEFYFVRRDIFSTNEDDHDIQDFKTLHSPTLVIRPIENWKFLATSEFKYNDNGPSGTYINRHFRSLFLITRENVLTEKEDGIKLDIGGGRRVFDRNHGAAISYGNNRINASMSKKFNPELSTSLLVQYLGNDPAKRKITNTTWKHSIELIPSFTYQITDKISYFFNDDFILNTSWYGDNAEDISISHEMNIGYITYQHNDQHSAYFQFKYLHSSSAPFQQAPGKNDSFEYYIGYTFAVTPKISFTPEVGSEIFAAKDGRDFFSKNIKYPEFALYLDIAL